MNYRLACKGLLGLALAALAQSATAQVSGLIGRLDLSQEQRNQDQSAYQAGDLAPSLFPEEDSDLGPQSVLKIKPRKDFLQASLDSQFQYTDNAFLQHDNRQKSGLLISTAQFELAPNPYNLGGGTYTPRIGYQSQWFDFFAFHSHSFSFSSQDFNAQTVFIDGRWHRGNWIVGGGFDYTRLLTTSSYDQLYAEYVPRWELQRNIPISARQTLAIAYQGYYHFTDGPAATLPENSTADRLDQVLTISYNYQPCENVIIQPFYSFKFTHFTAEVDREDYLHSTGIAMYYFILRNFHARAFVGYENRQSSVNAAEYHLLGVGAGLNFTLRF